MEDELKIVLKSEDALRLDMQDQKPLELLLGNAVTYTGTTNYNELGNKPSINGVTLVGNRSASDLGLQDALTFDDTPIENSTNPVKSGGVYEAASGKVAKAGDTMTGALTLKGNSIAVAYQNASGDVQGSLVFPAQGQLYIQEYNSSGVYTNFRLPAANGNNGPFDIITSLGGTMIDKLTAKLPTVKIGGTTALTDDPIQFSDSANKRYGLIRATENTDGSTELSFIHVPNIGGTNVWHGLTLGVNSDKSRYVLVSDDAAWRAGIGAVAKSGDTMTGNLVFNNGNYKGINLLGGSGAPSINFYNTGTRLTIDEYASGSTGGERYLLPIPVARSSDAWYDIFTSKDGVLAYRDQTVSVSVTANAFTTVSITEMLTAPTGYTYIGLSAINASTSGLRNGVYIMTNPNVNTLLIYSTTTGSGTVKIRAWYALSSAAKDKT